MRKILNIIDVFALLRGVYARTQYRRTFFRGEGYRENDAVSAGIQDVDTHAPCWNQVGMCVQIRPVPSTLRVFDAGTRYFFKENQTSLGCWNSAKKLLKYSKKVTLK